jgi:hypothetical protein
MSEHTIIQRNVLFLNISFKRALQIGLPEIKIEIDGPMKIQMASGFI